MAHHDVAGLSYETLQRLAAERRSHNVVEGLLLEVLLILHRHERHTMSAFDNIQASEAALAAQAAANASKVDALLAQLAAVNAQLAALQAAGGASADQLAALQAKIDADTAAIKSEDDKVDAVLTPPPAPSPAPEPSPPPADGSQQS